MSIYISWVVGPTTLGVKYRIYSVFIIFNYDKMRFNLDYELVSRWTLLLDGICIIIELDLML